MTGSPREECRPLIVGIGGTVVAGSSTETALGLALAAAAELGAATRMFDGAFLAGLPHYGMVAGAAGSDAAAYLAAVRAADGLIIASPGYHGSVSGLVKNAIDHVEPTARDRRVYFDGLPVGLIVTAHGWQATGSTLAALRSIVHSLRGWPTPLGVCINTAGGSLRDSACADQAVAHQLRLMGRQVVEFAALRRMAKGDEMFAVI